MQNIMDVIEKYKVDIAGKEVTYMIIQDLLADRTNFAYIGRGMIEEDKYPINHESDIAIGDQYKAYGLEEINMDPLFVFMGECEGEYIYAVTDRKVYKDTDGKVSKPIIQNFNLLDGDAETNRYYARPDVTYVRAKFIEELPYLEKTETDNVTGVGDMMDANALNCYNDKSYARMINHRVVLLPCGEDDQKIYAYVVYVGDLLLNRDYGPESVYGMYILTTPDNRFILVHQDKIKTDEQENNTENMESEQKEIESEQEGVVDGE